MATDVSFGVSLDSLVDFANKYNTKKREEYVYQNIVWFPESFMNDIKPYAEEFLKSRGIIASEALRVLEIGLKFL